jgi:F420-0:gamma-glutamyl ligase-like protein
VRTKYWRPGDDFLEIILRSIATECRDGDFVVLSEKALSVAMGRLVDEKRANPGRLARALAKVWMRMVWGRLLGRFCHLSKRTIRRLKQYPSLYGEIHKETVLAYAGLWDALLFYSEGGIDVTNLPYSFAALPLVDPANIAEKVRQEIRRVSGKHVTVMIVDTDKTYSRNGIYITPRPNAIRGIIHLGILATILGRGFRWTARATPLAVQGEKLSVETALTLAEFADKVRGYGAGRTVWDMSRRFNVGLGSVTWEMLDRVRHYPIVLVRAA